MASGPCTTPGLSRICLESYNQPRRVYDQLKRLGMSAVTITDHDAIDAAEELRGHPDFFLSEEATVRMPSGTDIHVGVYNLSERDHVEIQRRRTDFVSLLMYLTERKLFFSVNHVFSSLTGRREAEDFNWFASYVPAFETRNGQMWPEANASAARLATSMGKVGIAGSDAHTMAGVGRTFTEVPGARSIEEFFSGLRAGQGMVHGEHGTLSRLTADVFRIAKCVFQERQAMLAVLPFTVLIPAITASHWVNEIRFCKKWSAALEQGERRPRMLWDLNAQLDTTLAN
ncbi:MAG TPA: PHP domain-containing protein [Candidatus Dormibacteraeota bacterium]|nr:PHP domain-containing protein [Candidatus Dormibacteraeota bacterium]